MKKEYTEMSEFLDDVHNTLSLKEVFIDMGIIEK